MKTSLRDLMVLLKKDESSLLSYIGKKFKDFDSIGVEDLILNALYYVFFYKEEKFSYEILNRQKKDCEWLNKLVKSFYRICLETEDMNTALEFFNRLFSLHYDEITNKYFEFIKAFKQVNLKDKYDLYDCLISFLSFLNGNDKFLPILSKNQKNNNIDLLKKIYDERRNIGLWKAVTNYCEINGIRITFKYKNNNNNNLSIEKFNIDIRELK